MYERSYGSKYQEMVSREAAEGRYLGASDIAKLMRADIKAAQKAGDLPTDLKVSVTVENYSMGRSINITVPYRSEYWTVCRGTYDELQADGTVFTRGCGGSWYADHEPTTLNAPVHDVLTLEGQRVKRVIGLIHWAYNYDGSDSMTDYYDVNYGGHVEMETAESAVWAAQQRERKAQARTDAKAKAELIDHLFAEHRGSLRYDAKPGRLRQWYDLARLTEYHDGIHAKAASA